jgi:MYXO-CTERM domain-containing protein
VRGLFPQNLLCFIYDLVGAGTVKLRLFRAGVLVLIAPILLGIFNPAKAAITYWFSQMPMIDGVPGDQTLFASGSFTIPARNFGRIPILTSLRSPPTSVNFTVTNGGSFSRSFVDASYFLYGDGLGAGDKYVLSIGPQGDLDALYDQFYVSIMTINDVEIISTDFSARDFPRGYYSPNPVPFASVGGMTPETQTYAMLLAGLGLLGFLARRRKR